MSTTWNARVRDARIPATACLMVLTTITVASMSRVYADGAFLRPMLAVALGLHALALALRLFRVPFWAALPLLLAGAAELITLAHYRSTMNGPFPGSDTLDMLRLDADLVAEQFATAVAPVPSTGSFVVAGTLAAVLVVLLADSFAFRAMGRVEAVVPAGVLFVLGSALGEDRNQVMAAAMWIAAAVLTVAVLRFDAEDTDRAWMGPKLRLLPAVPAILLTAALGAGAAAAVAPKLPGAGEKALVDTRNRRSSVTEVVSPLVDIRATLFNRGNLELFTVSSSDGQGHYWRLISLPRFDGTAWNPPEESLEQMGDRSGDVLVDSALVEQRYTITGMGGPLVPAAYRATSVSPDAVYWAAGSESLVLPDGDSLQPGDQIAVQSLLPQPSADQLRSAGVAGADPIYLELPPGLPSVAYEAAAAVTASALTPYDKALALQQWFQTSFTYDPDVQLSNSSSAIEAFLRDRRGFCQQFSGTFAVMARMLGLPARVAVGFTPGDLGADGLFHVYGRHAHAWPEVWFEGIGWVPFEPTPGRGSADSQPYTGVPPAQATGGDPGGGTGETPVSTPATLVTVPGDRPTDPDGRPTEGGTGTETSPDSAARSAQEAPLWLLIALWALAAFVVWAIVAPFVLGWWWRRGARTQRERVIRAWHRARRGLELLGAAAPVGATPTEFAIAAERAVPVDSRYVRELATQVTAVVYAETELSEGAVDTAERLSRDVLAMCRDAAPWGLRARMRVSPGVIRRLAAG